MTDRDWVRVGEAVAVRRGQLGLSQQEARERAGVGITLWRLIENGAQGERRLPNLAAVAGALGWKPDALIRIAEGEDPANVELSAEESEIAQLRAEVERLRVLVEDIRPGEHR